MKSTGNIQYFQNKLKYGNPTRLMFKEWEYRTYNERISNSY
jgi:hypothetical protein